MNFSNKFQTAFAKVQVLNQALTQNTLEYKIPPNGLEGHLGCSATPGDAEDLNHFGISRNSLSILNPNPAALGQGLSPPWKTRVGKFLLLNKVQRLILFGFVALSLAHQLPSASLWSTKSPLKLSLKTSPFFQNNLDFLQITLPFPDLSLPQFLCDLQALKVFFSRSLLTPWKRVRPWLHLHEMLLKTSPLLFAISLSLLNLLNWDHSHF